MNGAFLRNQAKLGGLEGVRLGHRVFGAVEAVDLRYPNGYALRMRGVTTVVNDGGKPNPKTR